MERLRDQRRRTPSATTTLRTSILRWPQGWARNSRITMHFTSDHVSKLPRGTKATCTTTTGAVILTANPPSGCASQKMPVERLHKVRC